MWFAKPRRIRRIAVSSRYAEGTADNRSFSRAIRLMFRRWHSVRATEGLIYRAAAKIQYGSENKVYDVIVVGGGLVGVSISRMLALRNIKASIV
jgi:NADPH-dependent 2,4-dienoyl-CoA reductase/sulfur reductase-like enzyme